MKELPTDMKEMLPVKRTFFEGTTKALSLAIVNVIEGVEEQMLGLTKKQYSVSTENCNQWWDIIYGQIV